MHAGGETVFAPATAAGVGAVAILRISGPLAGTALCRLTGGELPPPRRLARQTLRDGAGEALDDALVAWFPGPGSFTGEDMVELHLHGGRAVVAAVAAAVGALPGLRPAEPGEFSRRAFLHGKLDLTAAEGLADLVAAETEVQRRQALRQLGGALAGLYDGWRVRLIAVLAQVEATIDFPDEDLPEGLDAAGAAAVDELATAVAAHLADSRRGERVRDGIHIVILGAPNAGKSTLLNRLAQREAAIVAATAGTTRDLIEVHLDLAGYPATLVDTAGLREAADAVEREGVRRAEARAAEADLAVLLVAAGEPLPAALAPHLGERALLVLNKVDLLSGPPPAALDGWPALPLSLRTGAGLEGLLTALAERVAARFALAPDAGITRARHRLAAEACLGHLRAALGLGEAELVAEELRLAARALGRVTGSVDVEEVLDALFAGFCIGK